MKRITNYKIFYEQVTAPIRRHPPAVKGLRLMNRLLTVLMYAAYPLGLLLLLRVSLRACILSILVPGISFAALSLVRKKINRQRPYEKWDIEPIIRKNTRGNSMPSRHIFSSAVISMVYLRFFPPVGIIFLLLSGISAVIRVLGGVHYPSDVAAGYIAGVLAGLLLFLHI